MEFTALVHSQRQSDSCAQIGSAMAAVEVGPASLRCAHAACRFKGQLTEHPTHALVLCATQAPPPKTRQAQQRRQTVKVRRTVRLHCLCQVLASRRSFDTRRAQTKASWQVRFFHDGFNIVLIELLQHGHSEIGQVRGLLVRVKMAS